MRAAQVDLCREFEAPVGSAESRVIQAPPAARLGECRGSFGIAGWVGDDSGFRAGCDRIGRG